VYGDALDVVFKGFVNQLRISIGLLTVTLGPMLNLANRVAVLYTPQTVGTYGIASGSQQITDDADDTDSQGAFGIWPVVLSSGATTLAEAENHRDKYLYDNKWPKTTESLSDSSRSPSVQVDCLGYMHMLNFPYTNATITTPYYAHTKILAILAASPKISWFNPNTVNVNTNNLSVQSREVDYRPALTILKEIVAAGGATNDLRWMFQILEDQNVYYTAVPTSIDYMAYVANQGLIIYSADQAEVAPWRVRPGHWLSLDDFMVGRAAPALTSADSSLQEDPRLMFIEKVTYTAPYGLRLYGGNTDEINQLLGKFGLKGIA